MTIEDDDDLFGGDDLDENLQVKDEPIAVEPERTRQDKKNQRGELLRMNEELRTQNQDLHTRLARLEGATAEREAAERRRQQQDPANDPLANEIAYCDKRLIELSAESDQAYQAKVSRGEKWTEKDRDEWSAKALGIQNHKSRLIARQAMNDAGVRPTDPAEQARQRLSYDYPEVTAHPRAYEYARSLYNAEIQAGTKDDKALVDRVMSDARQRFGLGEKQERGDRDRRRENYTGSGASGGGGGASRSGGSGRTFITKDEAKMAEALFPKLDKKAAHAKWVKEVRDQESADG